MKISFDFINAEALIVVQKVPDSISDPTMHMSRSQSRTHNLMELSSYKDTKCSSKTECHQSIRKGWVWRLEIRKE